MTDFSGDKVTNHVIIEIARNSDKAYVSQTLMYDASSEKVTGYFTQFENEDIWSAIGEKEIGKEFKYNSIYGKSGIKLDDMIGSFKIMTRITFIDGEAKVTNATD